MRVVAILFALTILADQRPQHPPDIHFAATPQPIADAMLQLAHVTRDDVVYDLGSGDGRIVILVTFIEGDLFEADISEATVVALWLSASVNARLEPKLKRELRPGARVVSHQFPIGSWQPDAHVRVENEDVFLWTIQ